MDFNLLFNVFIVVGPPALAVGLIVYVQAMLSKREHRTMQQIAMGINPPREY